MLGHASIAGISGIGENLCATYDWRRGTIMKKLKAVLGVVVM